MKKQLEKKNNQEKREKIRMKQNKKEIENILKDRNVLMQKIQETLDQQIPYILHENETLKKE